MASELLLKILHPQKATRINGATSADYTLVAADAGQHLRATVSYTDQQQTAETVASSATAQIGSARTVSFRLSRNTITEGEQTEAVVTLSTALDRECCEWLYWC